MGKWEMPPMPTFRDQCGLEKQRGERRIEKYLRQIDDRGLMP